MIIGGIISAALAIATLPITILGGVLSAGASAVGGIAGAAGGLMGGGESGNVKRDETDGGERVYGAERFGSKSSTTKTPGGGGGSSKALVVPQTSMLGSTDLASSEGSSPGDVLVSIFKSMQQSLSSIDNTLRSMLNVDTATLAMEKKSDVQDNLKERDTDRKKGPGFFSRVGSKVKGAVDRIKPTSGGGFSKILKTLAVGGLVILFAKYKEQITAAIQKVIGYFFELETVFQNAKKGEGFKDVLTKVMDDLFIVLAPIGKKIETILVKFWEETMLPMLKDFFMWALQATKDFIFGKKSTKVKTEEAIVDIIETESNLEENAKNIAEGDGSILDYARTFGGDTATVESKRKLTKDSKGVITWEVDINDRNVKLEDRVNARPVMDGVIYPDVKTILETPELKKKLNDLIAKGTDFDVVARPFINPTTLEAFQNIPKGLNFDAGPNAYNASDSNVGRININEEIMRLRGLIEEDLAQLSIANRSKGFIKSRTKKIISNQEKIKALGGNVNEMFDYDKFVTDPTQLRGYNTKRLNTLQSENIDLGLSSGENKPLTVYSPVNNTSNTSVSNNNHPATGGRSDSNDGTANALAGSHFNGHPLHN